MVKHFDSCLCTNLRTGTIIIGSLGVIGGFFYFLAPLVPTESGKDDMPGGAVTRIIRTILGIANIIICIVLIVGAVKRNAKMIYPWIILSVVGCVLAIIIAIALGVYAVVTGHIGAGISILISMIIATLIEVYCILIVNSFYTTLKNGEPVATQPA